MLVILAGVDKMLVRIANREDPDQKQSDHCFTVCLGLFLQAISVFV